MTSPPARRGARLVLACLVLVLALGGCGGDDRSGGAAASTAGPPRLVVSAATSLKVPLTRYGEGFDGARVALSFAGSDELAAQIRQGVRPDVFAAANPKLPAQLRREGLVGRPVVFAGNRLVLAVPAGARRVGSLDDLTEEGVTVAVGAPSVPVGSYTRAVLARLGAREREAILANVRSEEPDVAGVVGKLTQGAVDAGFVYRTDVAASDGRLRALELPARLGPRVAYAAAVVTGAAQPEAARRFLDGLRDGPGAQALRDAGFEPPPR